VAFCDISPGGESGTEAKRAVTITLRCIGLAALVFLAFTFRSAKGNPMIRLSPFSIHHIWYGILGYIGWAYLMSSVAYLIFRNNLTALLGCAVLMMCLYPANKLGLFNGWWIAKHVNIGVALGSRAAITALGLMMGVMLQSSAGSVGARTRFTLLLAAGCTAAALLLEPLYGVSKENATPSWSLWGCAITAALWLVFYLLCDVGGTGFIARPLAVMGRNVLLPYLISEMLPDFIALMGLTGWYDGLAEPSLSRAITRSATCAVVIMAVSVGVNRAGVRLKL
jgi:heparan-alpha-glucosaminide N-acetyltransferase